MSVVPVKRYSFTVCFVKGSSVTIYVQRYRQVFLVRVRLVVVRYIVDRLTIFITIFITLWNFFEWYFVSVSE